MSVLYFLLCILTALCWALSPILIKTGINGSGVNEVNPIRSIGFLLTTLVGMLIFQPHQWPSITPALTFWLTLNILTSAVLGDQIYIYSIEKIGASLAISISCAYPLVTAIFSIFILDEKITVLVWLGTVLIIIGLLLIRYDASKKENRPNSAERVKPTAKDDMLKGIALAVGAAILWGVNIPFIKKLFISGGWSAMEYYFLRAVIFMIIIWIIRIVQHIWFPHVLTPMRKVSLTAWVALMAGGSLALAIGGLLFMVCIQALPVSVVTPITAASPFITVLLARFTHNEKLSKFQSAGVTLVIIGALAVSL